jgi:phage-related protein
MAKPLHWVGSSRKDVLEFPDDVRSEVGYTLWLAQLGDKGINAIPMVGFGSAKVLEVVIDDAGGTYRAVYTVKFAKAVYVLHAFQKKAKHGIATPQSDLNLIKRRLNGAEEHYKLHYEAKERKDRRHDRSA